MMRRGFSIVKVSLVLSFVIVSVSVFVAQTRNRPATAPASDFKVKYQVTVRSAGAAGQTSESVTMIKGPRERSEKHSGYGLDTIDIMQCDLKRTIQISVSAKKYMITQMETREPNAVGTTERPAASSVPTSRGGIITYTTSIVDTGERKEMFGFTARHVKSSTIIESSPNACTPVKHRSELDGWYIDLNVGLDCRSWQPAVIPNRVPPSGGCQDQPRFKREGTGKTGFPLIETTTMYGDGGQVMFTMTREVIELSRQPLDSALFDLPAGYTEATTTQELYGMPSVASIMSGVAQGQAADSDRRTAAANSSSARKPGSVLIGVVQINNKAGRPISQDALRQRLVGQIEGAGLDAVALNASSQMEAEVEAKAKQCDFILYTDIAALKVNKLGGMFGRVTGVEGAGKTEAKLEFKLFAVGETTPRLQSSASAKEEGDEASAGTAIDTEAKIVSAEVKKRGRG
jgi:hypothetical protein